MSKSRNVEGKNHLSQVADQMAGGLSADEATTGAVEFDFDCDSSTFRKCDLWQPAGGRKITNGTRRIVNEQEFIHYDGYWIRYYRPPPDTLKARKNLIESLTRRTFHHTEHGINTPGSQLPNARESYERETDPKKKRVNAAMLAGALFNRATDIFRTIVDLAEKGVEVSHDNELMKECGQSFKEALELGKQVKHYSGQEGIDELWGEPFKAFSVPIESFYESRFIKIAQAMHNVDTIADALKRVLNPLPGFSGAEQYIDCFATAAKYECETMRSDAKNNFIVWPQFVSAGEKLTEYTGQPYNDPDIPAWLHSTGLKLIFDGKSLIEWVALARVPMPVQCLSAHNCLRTRALSSTKPLKVSVGRKESDFERNLRYDKSGSTLTTRNQRRQPDSLLCVWQNA